MNVEKNTFTNPYRPGAGHMPPYLAGREPEITEFRRLLDQETILENMVLTGLRGVGKTVLLERFKPLAIDVGWLWVGADLSESTSVTEENLAMRLMADLAVVTSNIVIASNAISDLGFSLQSTHVEHRLDFPILTQIYRSTPGLASDKIKKVLEIVWTYLAKQKSHGLIFAYDEAQNLSDHATKEQYPLSLLLDVFQSIQRKNIPFMLVLTGLPTLFPKLVEARTFAERMFRVVFLDKLGEEDSREAIVKPIEQKGSPVTFNSASVEKIILSAGGYPYFIQFICREVYDVFLQKLNVDEPLVAPLSEIVRKLDSDFFAGRWARATDRQRELLTVIAYLDNADSEFTVQEIVELSKDKLEKPFSNSHISQMLVSLAANGLIYKNRYGKYSFAVPLLDQFIKRQDETNV